MTRPPAFEKLYKILKLEADTGYRDKAMIGGLSQFAVRWQQEAGTDDTAQRVAALLRTYSDLKPVDPRRIAINQMVQLMGFTTMIKPDPNAATQAPIAPEAAPQPDRPARPERPERNDRAEKTDRAAPVQSSTPAAPPSAAPVIESKKIEPPSTSISEAQPVPVETKPAPQPRPAPRPTPQRPPEPERRPQPRPEPEPRDDQGNKLGLSSPVTAMSGIGASYGEKLARLGVTTIGDLLWLLPRRYDDFSNLKPINRLEFGEEVTVMGSVWDATEKRIRGGSIIFTATLSDGSGLIQCTWFNNPYVRDKLKRGMQIVVSGKVTEYNGQRTFQVPEWEPVDTELLNTARIVPVYPLTEGLGNRWLRKMTKRAVDYWASRVEDTLPVTVRNSAGVMNLSSAIAQAHFPDSMNSLEAARKRLAFDELFFLQVGLLKQKQQWRGETGQAISIDPVLFAAFVQSLPFELTEAQRRVITDIVQDIRTERPMSRLLQGDVGSGKTAVAASAMFLTVQAGLQAAIMAPTEILAEQHFKNLSRMFAPVNAREIPYRLNVRLLTGSTPASERETILAEIADGTANIVVGTHALIQETVAFKNLALAIVDEQHRFGVAQRAALRQKGFNPHVLVMTATPIPRTLALTLFGDLDLSVIDQLPPGRQPIDTRILLPTERERAYAFIRAQIEQGRQAFIICPLVEESDKIEAKAAVEEHARLQKHVFSKYKLGLMHGRMKPDEKDAAMRAFAANETQILVSTSVVEVGIDVPNANVIMIEGAERFGLAQLHQFRGRVGRGQHQSYCLLQADTIASEVSARLRAVEASTDGFVLAEKDLELRGPGQFFGTRQSGLPDMHMGNIADARLIDLARREAEKLLVNDPELNQTENLPLAQRLAEFWQTGAGDLS